jgi:hypothetical protein
MNHKNKSARRLVHAPAGSNLKQRRHYPSYAPYPQGRFNQFFLPNPIQILHQLGLPAEKTNAKGYFKLRCPFHKNGNEKNPSLNLHKTTGHYRCHACGAKGSNILAFYMNITGKSFATATKELGIWGNQYDK